MSMYMYVETCIRECVYPLFFALIRILFCIVFYHNVRGEKLEDISTFFEVMFINIHIYIHPGATNAHIPKIQMFMYTYIYIYIYIYIYAYIRTQITFTYLHICRTHARRSISKIRRALLCPSRRSCIYHCR